jgi:hypothetical protein
MVPQRSLSGLSQPVRYCAVHDLYAVTDIHLALISYVVTIGSWSFVWTCFIGRQIFLRWKMNIMRGKSFGAMNVLFLAGIQSMILPSMNSSSSSGSRRHPFII